MLAARFVTQSEHLFVFGEFVPWCRRTCQALLADNTPRTYLCTTAKFTKHTHVFLVSFAGLNSCTSTPRCVRDFVVRGETSSRLLEVSVLLSGGGGGGAGAASLHEALEHGSEALRPHGVALVHHQARHNTRPPSSPRSAMLLAAGCRFCCRAPKPSSTALFLRPDVILVRRPRRPPPLRCKLAFVPRPATARRGRAPSRWSSSTVRSSAWPRTRRPVKQAPPFLVLDPTFLCPWRCCVTDSCS